MNIRNVMFMFLLFGGSQIVNAIGTLKIVNNLDEKVLVCVDGDKVRPHTINGKSDYTLPSIPNALGVKKEGGIFHESRMQEALEDIKSEIHNNVPAGATNVTAYMNINVGPNRIIHPFAFITDVKYQTAPPTAPGRPAGGPTPEEQLKNNAITPEQYLKIVENNPGKYGELSNEIRQLREHFERQNEDYKGNLLRYRNHPYQKLIRTTYQSAKHELKLNDLAPFLKDLKTTTHGYLTFDLPNYMRDNKERYGLVD